jgi:Fe-S-cluster containining protein
MKKQIIVPDSCEGCGQCCDFPDGSRCKDLDCNKSCGIYDTRPQVCKDFVRGSISCLIALRLNRF